MSKADSCRFFQAWHSIWRVFKWQGWTNENWLKSRFHFNFAEYSEGPSSFGVLRVMNDDLVQAERGLKLTQRSQSLKLTLFMWKGWVSVVIRFCHIFWRFLDTRIFMSCDKDLENIRIATWKLWPSLLMATSHTRTFGHSVDLRVLAPCKRVSLKKCQDSMGTEETLGRGSCQFMTSGEKIRSKHTWYSWYSFVWRW